MKRNDTSLKENNNIKRNNGLLLLVCLVSLLKSQIELDKTYSFDFDNLTLNKVVLSISKESNLNIFLANAQNEIRITANFKNESLKKIINTIFVNNGFNYSYDIKSKSLYIKEAKFTVLKVLNKTTGKVLSGAGIYKNKKLIGLTDTLGLSEVLSSISIDTIIIRHVGYRVRKYLPGDLKKGLNILEMEERPYQSETINVKENLNSDIAGQDILSQNEFFNHYRKISNDVFLLLQKLPGLSCANNGLTSLSIRGAPSSYHSVIYDGSALYHLEHLLGYISSINYNIVDYISVYKGAYPSRFGGWLSGIIDIKSKSSNFNDFNLKVGSNLLHSHFHMEIPVFNNLSLVLSYRRSVLDLYPSHFSEEILRFVLNKNLESSNPNVTFVDLEEETQDISFYDMNAKLTYLPSENDHISISIFKSYDKKEFINSYYTELTDTDGKILRDNVPVFNHEFKDWNNESFSVSWLRKWSKQFTSRFLSSGSIYFKDYFNDTSENTNRIEYNEDNNEIKENVIEFEAFYRNSDEFAISGGYNQKRIQTKHYYNYELIYFDSYIEDQDKRNVIDSYFLESEYNHTVFNLKGGLRYNSDEKNSPGSWEYRGSFTYFFQPFELGLSYGKNHQYIKFIHDHGFTKTKKSFWTISEASEHKFEEAYNRAISLKVKKDNAEYRLETFHNSFHNISFYVNNKMFIHNAIGRQKGLEFFYSLKYKNYGLLLRYILSKSTYEFDNGISFPFKNDRKQQLNTDFVYRNNSFTFALNLIYHSGFPATYLDSNDKLKEEEELIHKVNNSRFNNYLNIDLDFSYLFRVMKVNLETGMKLYNILNRKHSYRRYYHFEDTVDEYIKEEVKMIGFLPSLYFNIEL